MSNTSDVNASHLNGVYNIRAYGNVAPEAVNISRLNGVYNSDLDSNTGNSAVNISHLNGVYNNVNIDTVGVQLLIPVI